MLTSPARTWYLGRVGPIPLYASHSSLILVLLVAYFQNFDPYMSAIFLGIIVSAIVLHELGHGFGAMLVRHQPRYIVLHALGGVCYTQRSAQPQPWREIIVLIAGPLVNVLLLLMGILAVMIIGQLAPDWLFPRYAEAGLSHLSLSTFFLDGSFIRYAVNNTAGTVLTDILYYGVMINALLAIFNMLPIFPLDGGQMFLQLLRWLGVSVSLAKRLTLGAAVVTAIAALWWLHGSGPIRVGSLLYNLVLMGLLLQFAFVHLRQT